VGRCPECQSWSSVTEVAASASRPAGIAAGPVGAPARPMTEVDVHSARARPTGLGELDRVLGGGLVPGAVVLVAGEPGVGKSTLLLEVCAALARSGRRTLYVTGEESAGQVRLRAERTGAVHERLWLADETDLGAVLAHVEAVDPDLLVLDSVQTISTSAAEGVTGGVTQVREVAAGLSRVAKARGMATLLVGHVTKDGSVAGPRVLEHLVDVVLQFEGERHTTLRLLRAVKNRFGPADEVGCFEQTDTGIVGVPDPSGLFLSHTETPVAGTCVTVTVEGRRAMVAEVQALVVDAPDQAPLRRAVSGLDANRVSLLVAVAHKRAGVPIGRHDVYASTIGGVRLSEPAADLAVTLALASAATNKVLPAGFVVIGEVGLAGEVRRVPAAGRRLAEAARLGFTRALVPVGTTDTTESRGTASEPRSGLTLHEVADVSAALAFLIGDDDNRSVH
jgi:DNA repair protein RadA/Sms